MRAVRASASHGAVLDEVEVPKVGRGMALIKTLRAGICGSDLHVLRALERGLIKNANYMGHEVSGLVADLGEDVEGVQIGERVTVEPLARCGRCRNCRAGAYNICANREFVLGNYTDRPGGLADYFQVPAYCLVPLAAGLTDKEGALVEPLAVGVHALRMARPGYRPSVGIIGAGSIGLASIAAAIAAGASSIAVIARHDHQRAAALRLGATRVFAAEEDSSEQTLIERLEGDPLPEIVVETVGGRAGTVNLALNFAHPGGTIAMVGGYWENHQIDLNRLLMKELRITASNCYASPGGASDFKDAMGILRRNPAFAEAMVTHEYGLDDATEAFRTALDKHTGSIKVMLTP